MRGWIVLGSPIVSFDRFLRLGKAQYRFPILLREVTNWQRHSVQLVLSGKITILQKKGTVAVEQRDFVTTPMDYNLG